MILGKGYSQPVITWEREKVGDLIVNPPSTFPAVASDRPNPSRSPRSREPTESVSTDHLPMANRWGNNENSDWLYFLGLQNYCTMVTAAMN